jgi:hypothetical protein
MYIVTKVDLAESVHQGDAKNVDHDEVIATVKPFMHRLQAALHRGSEPRK